MGPFKLTLQWKYSLSFSIIFLVVLLYVTNTLFESEKEDLIRLSMDNFQTLLASTSSIAAESMTGGAQEKITFRDFLNTLFGQDIQGLISIRFVSARDQTVYAFRNAEGTYQDGGKLPDEEWTILKSNADQVVGQDDPVTIIRTINYQLSDRTVFIGYGELTYSLTHINERIAEKQANTNLIGFLSILISIGIISLVTQILIKRIKAIHGATRAVAGGKYDPIPVEGNDELSDLMSSFNEMITSVKERLMMSKYVSGSTIEMIKGKRVDEQVLGGQKEELLLFFSDIRGFTAFSEKNSPDTVVRYLNELLDEQVKILDTYKGDVDKFVGDEIMAAFRGEGKEQRAIEASVKIQQKMKELSEKDATYSELKIGIGLNSGEVVTGNIGSHNRMDFTAIGDAVNTAARLCSNAGADEIIVSEVVKLKIPPKSFLFSRPFYLELKNKKEKIKLFRVNYA